MTIRNKIFKYIHDYKFNSLFLRNFIIIFLAVAIPTVLLHSIMYNFSKKNALEYAYSANNELCSTIRDISDSICDEMTMLTIATALSNDVNKIMLFPEDDSYDSVMVDYIHNLINVYDYLSTIYIYCDDTKKIICADENEKSFYDIDDRNWFEYFQNIKSDDMLVCFRACENNYPYFLTFIKPVFTTNSHKTGAVIFNVDIEKLCSSYIKKSRVTLNEFMIVDKVGKILYDTDRNKIFTNVSENQVTAEYSKVNNMSAQIIENNKDSYIVSRMSSKTYDWDYYCAIQTDFYRSNFSDMITTLLIMVMISIIISIAISTYISKKIFSPIESIMDILDDPAPWNNLSPTEYKNETDYILNKISNAKQVNLDLMDEIDKKIVILKRAQTLMLQMQINPHFLGNTLNVIKWLAFELTMSENKASYAITKLARMFNEYSKNTDYMTNVEKEIEYTKKYIDILMIRYPDRFTVDWDIDPTCYDAKIPRLSFQPIIENAVYYGIVPNDKPGRIIVEAKTENNFICISISDNGKGMSSEKIDAINNEFLNDYVSFNGHIGLKNVNQRLRLIYGGDYGLKLTESQNGGVTVIMNLPFIS